MMARPNYVRKLFASLLLLSVLGSNAQTQVSDTTTDLKALVDGVGVETSHVFSLGAGTFSCGGILIGAAKNITFVGQGASSTVISCDGNGRHFQVENGGILSVHGIKLFNGSADNGGAIIASSGADVFLRGGTEVESCRATAGNGGAIDMQGNSKLSCDGTVYKSNMASGKGGAIYVEGSSAVTIAGASSFDGNTAASGGAIVFSTARSTVNIASSVSISGNTPGTSDFSECRPDTAPANATFDGLVVEEQGICSSKCDSGFTASSGSFMDPGTCNVCGVSCLLGQKDASCTAYAAGECTACTPVENGAFTSSGKGTNPNFECDFSCNAGYYKTSTSCLACNVTSCGAGYFRTACGSITDSQCAQCTGLPSNAKWTSTGSSTVAPGGCEWECEDGWYKNGTQCTQCQTTQCPVGQYRGACGGVLTGACRACSGPGSALFTTAGAPFNEDNCEWICNANGILNNSWWNPITPTTTPAPAPAPAGSNGSSVNSSSSNGNETSGNATRRLLQADNSTSNETSATTTTTTPAPAPATTPTPIVAVGPAGASAFSEANCQVGEFLGKCWCEPCTNGGSGATYSTVGGYDANDCKFECDAETSSAADGSCIACQANPPACPVGQKRGPCTDDNPLGPCMPCGNAPGGAVYVESTADVAECNWECPLGHPVVDGQCSLCRIGACGIGGYRSGCAADGTGGSCLACTGKPKLATYSSAGSPYDQNNCEWLCYSTDEEPVNDADCCPIANLTMIVKLSVDGSMEVDSLVSALEKVVEGVAEKSTKRVCVSAEVYVPAAVSGGEGGPSPSEGGGETSISGRRQTVKKEVSIQTVVNAPAADLEGIQYSVTTSAIQEGLAGVGITATVSEITVTAGGTERGGGGPDVGAIVGGTIGGLAGVLLIGAAYWKFSRGDGISLPSFSSPKSPGRHTPAAGGHKAPTPKKLQKDDNTAMSARAPSIEKDKDIETSVAPTATATLPGSG